MELQDIQLLYGSSWTSIDIQDIQLHQGHPYKSQWCFKTQLVHQSTSKTPSCNEGYFDHPNKCFDLSRNNLYIDRHPRHPVVGHLQHPYKSLCASSHNLCINSHPRHQVASRITLIIHINLIVLQNATFASIDIQDIQLHRGSS